MKFKPVSTKKGPPTSVVVGCMGITFSLMFGVMVAMLWSTTITPQKDFFTLAAVVVLFTLSLAAAVISVVLFVRGDPQETFLRKQTAAFRSKGKTAVAYNDSDRRLLGDVKDEAMQGPQELESSITPGCTGLLLMLMAFFWITFATIGNDRTEPQLLVVKIVLAVSGLSIVGGFVYWILSLFNPRVVLSISSGAVERGGSADIVWQLRGRTSRIKLLKIKVEGEEFARYREGNSSSSSYYKHTFSVIPVANAIEPKDIQRGKATINIPTDVMHSFDADQNQVLWKIVVDGEIPWWPDIHETFTFRVKP